MIVHNNSRQHLTNKSTGLICTDLRPAEVVDNHTAVLGDPLQLDRPVAKVSANPGSPGVLNTGSRSHVLRPLHPLVADETLHRQLDRVDGARLPVKAGVVGVALHHVGGVVRCYADALGQVEATALDEASISPSARDIKRWILQA